MSSSENCHIELPDISKYNYPGTPTEMATWEVALKCGIMGIIILLGVIGNSLVIIIVSVSKKMRTTINFYIVNMAIADLFVACFPAWIHVTTDVTDGWIVGEFICKFNAFVQSKHPLFNSIRKPREARGEIDTLLPLQRTMVWCRYLSVKVGREREKAIGSSKHGSH